jgi:hypothetical protein
MHQNDGNDFLRESFFEKICVFLLISIRDSSFLMMITLLLCSFIQCSNSNNFLDVASARKFLRIKYPYDSEFTSHQNLSTISHSFFHDIHSSKSGGALFYHDLVRTIVDDCCFCFVSSTKTGGAIFLNCMSMEVSRTSGYHCEEADYYENGYGYGTFLYLNSQDYFNPSVLRYCVVSRCPNQNSKYLYVPQAPTINFFGSNPNNLSFSNSNFSENYLTAKSGLIKIRHFRGAKIMYNTLTDNYVTKPEANALIEFDYSKIVSFEYNNILRNSGASSLNALIYISNGILEDLSNYFEKNKFVYFLKAGDSGIAFITNSYFGTNFFSYFGNGSYSVLVRPGFLQSSPIFDVKCWLYYSLFTADFKGVFENEIDLGSLSTYSDPLTPSASSSSSVSEYATESVGGNSSSQLNVEIIVGVIIAVLIGLVVIFIVAFFASRKNKNVQEKSPDSSQETETDAIPPVYNDYPYPHEDSIHQHQNVDSFSNSNLNPHPFSHFTDNQQYPTSFPFYQSQDKLNMYLPMHSYQSVLLGRDDSSSLPQSYKSPNAQNIPRSHSKHS